MQRLTFLLLILLSLETYAGRIQYLGLGCGNLSEVLAYVEKKIRNEEPIPDMIVSDLMSEGEMHAIDGVNDRIKTLENLQTEHGFKFEIRYSVDATKLHELNLPHAEAIHFNMPHNRARFQSGQMQALIANFFQSAKKIQKPGDKVYIAVPQKFDSHYYQAYYNLAKASTDAGYKLYRKRPFTKISEGKLIQRYPGYDHRQTGGNNRVEAADNAREYVFELTEDQPNAIRAKQPAKNGWFYSTRCEIFGDVPTDEESDAGDFTPPAPDLDYQSQDELDSQEDAAKK